MRAAIKNLLRMDAKPSFQFKKGLPDLMNSKTDKKPVKKLRLKETVDKNYTKLDKDGNYWQLFCRCYITRFPISRAKKKKASKENLMLCCLGKVSIDRHKQRQS